LPANLDQRARDLAWRAISAVPGLSGYVGVDLVLGETDVAIEINPRLTTSYVGYRALARFNLAQALLARFGLASFPTEVTWETDEISFSAAGDLLPAGGIPRIISWR
jgi:predicted ATP-grasp superfamily ATP-dependent carboligase